MFSLLSHTWAAGESLKKAVCENNTTLVTETLDTWIAMKCGSDLVHMTITWSIVKVSNNAALINYSVAVRQLTCCSLTRSRCITRSSSWITWVWPFTSTAALWLCTCTARTTPGRKACWDRSVDVCSINRQRLMCSVGLMMSCVSGLPAGCCPPRLVLLHSLLLCKASFPAAIPAPQEALSGGANGRSLPAGHQPRRPPSLYL